MENSELGELLKNPDSLKRIQQETLLLEVASLIYNTMKSKGIKPSELAQKLGITKGRVSQYLGGEKNLRLRTLADIFTALKCKLQVDVEPLCENDSALIVGERVQKLRLKSQQWDFIDTCVYDAATYLLPA